MKPCLSLIAAIDEDSLLANEHRIPWQLPDDVAHFRAYCAGKWILVGRSTFEEMSGWFGEDKTPLVLTTACGYDPAVGRAVASVPQAVALAAAHGEKELVCIGGGQVFAATLPEADRLVITHIHHRVDPGTRPIYFPAILPETWEPVHSQDHPADEAHPWPFSIVEYRRRA